MIPILVCFGALFLICHAPVLFLDRQFGYRDVSWLPDHGPVVGSNSAPIRLDGYPHDADGCVYWWLSTVLPGFRQFRYPAKLFTLADVYYPGWELTIDVKPPPIYRVNGVMRGAAVLSGAHRLVYTYAPQSFRVGRLVSVAALAVLMVAGLACARWPVDPVLGVRL